MTSLNDELTSGKPELSIGSFLRTRRDTLGMSQKDVADKANVGLSVYKQYERDAASPPLEKAARLAHVLDFKPSELFAEIENPEFPINLDTDQGNGEIPRPGQTVADAVRRVQNLARWKGLASRHIPGALVDAETLLTELDLDELESIAAELEFGFVNLTPKDEFLAMDADSRDTACENLLPRILVAALYGDTFETMGIEELQAAANYIRDTLYDGSGFIEGQFILDSDERYRRRLHEELIRHVIEAAKRRKPVMLSSEGLVLDETAESTQDEPEQELEKNL